MIEDLYQKFLNSTGVSTDTRTIHPGNIFFALRGPQFNANEFAHKAIESGASYAVVDDPAMQKDPRNILVNDSLQTLQDLASWHRDQLKIPMIGLTGSNGKTTTKELIHAVLSRKYKTYATRGNLNNHIGVPLTLLAIRENIEIGIIEMGANKIGDIRELCEIARPTHGLVTNIGYAHIEGFGSYEGVLQGKTELYDWLLKHEGTVFINSLDPVLSNMVKRFKDPVLFPGENDFYHCTLGITKPFIQIRDEKGNQIHTRLIGSYNFLNVATSLCIGKYFNVSPEAAKEGIENYEPRNNRSQLMKKGTNTVILDAYNANPSSMEAALNQLNEMNSQNKVVILGDMFELGDYTEEGHGRIGALTKKMNFKQVFFCGERMQFAHTANRDSLYFRTRKELEDFLENHIFENSTILIKGSRAMALENIIDKL